MNVWGVGSRVVKSHDCGARGPGFESRTCALCAYPVMLLFIRLNPRSCKCIQTPQFVRLMNTVSNLIFHLNNYDANREFVKFRESMAAAPSSGLLNAKFMFKGTSPPIIFCCSITFGFWNDIYYLMWQVENLLEINIPPRLAKMLPPRFSTEHLLQGLNGCRRLWHYASAIHSFIHSFIHIWQD